MVSSADNMLQVLRTTPRLYIDANVTILSFDCHVAHHDRLGISDARRRDTIDIAFAAQHAYIISSHSRQRKSRNVTSSILGKLVIHQPVLIIASDAKCCFSLFMPSRNYFLYASFLRVAAMP